MQIPSLFHAVDLQTHVKAGSLSAESVPLHPVQTIELVHPVQLPLHSLINLVIIFHLK